MLSLRMAYYCTKNHWEGIHHKSGASATGGRLDICKAIAYTLEAPRDIVHNQIFNVGDTTNNWRVKEIAEIITETSSGCKFSFGDSSADNRSYRGFFEKINQSNMLFLIALR